jgi:hypothetical protein
VELNPIKPVIVIHVDKSNLMLIMTGNHVYSSSKGVLALGQLSILHSEKFKFIFVIFDKKFKIYSETLTN